MFKIYTMRKDASAYAAQLAAHYTGFSVEQMCRMVYNIVVDRLYKRLYRSMITAEYPELGTRRNEEGSLEKVSMLLREAVQVTAYGEIS